MRDGLMIAVMKGKPKTGPPPALESPGAAKATVKTVPPEKPVAEPKPEMEARGISPEAVSFRTEDQVCGNCEYMGADGMCQHMKFEVAPQQGCNLFEQKEQQEAETEPEEGREMMA